MADNLKKYFLKIFDLGCWLTLAFYVFGFYFNTILIVTGIFALILIFIFKCDLFLASFLKSFKEIDECLKNRKWPSTLKAWTLVASGALILFSFLGAPIFRYLAFGTWRWDLGALENIIWRGTHGYGFSTHLIYNNAKAPLQFIHQHLCLWLYPMKVIYSVFPFAQTLLIFQSLALISVVIPLWKIGKKLFPISLSPLILPSLYFLVETVHRVNLWDVHENAFIPFMTAWAFYFFVARRFWLCFIFTCGVAIFKEDAFVLAGAMGFYFFGSYHKWIKATFSLAIGFLIFLSYGTLVSEGIPLAQRYGYLGSSMAEAKIIILTRPWVFLKQLVSLSNLPYYLNIFLLSGGLWVLGGLALVTMAPPFFEIALSTYDGMRNVDNHYIIPLIVPLLFCSAQSLVFLSSRLKQNQLNNVVATALIITSFGFKLGEASKIQDFTTSPDWNNRSCYATLLEKIPNLTPVYTTEPFVSHLTHRPILLTYNESTYREIPNSFILIPSDLKKPLHSEAVDQKCGYQLFKAD